MAKHLLVVLTVPVGGQQQELDDRYRVRHVPDLLAVPSTVCATRYKVETGKNPGSSPAWLTRWNTTRRVDSVVRHKFVRRPDLAVAEHNAFGLVSA